MLLVWVVADRLGWLFSTPRAKIFGHSSVVGGVVVLHSCDSLMGGRSSSSIGQTIIGRLVSPRSMGPRSWLGVGRGGTVGRLRGGRQVRVMDRWWVSGLRRSRRRRSWVQVVVTRRRWWVIGATGGPVGHVGGVGWHGTRRRRRCHVFRRCRRRGRRGRLPARVAVCRGRFAVVSR